MTNPLSHARRTPLRRLLESAGAEWRDLGDAAVAWKIGGETDATRLAIVDLSPLPRLGFKGRGTIAAMKNRGVFVVAEPNKAFRQADGGLCLVLGPGEILLLSNFTGDGASLDAMPDGWRIEDEEDTYPLLRRDSHAWFAVTGGDAPAMFAKLCAVDLRLNKFPDLSIAQTSAANMTVIIARADDAGTPVYHLLADSASAVYLCSCLVDAAAEFGGRMAGLSALRGLWDS